jgi:hypothetical protein
MTGILDSVYDGAQDIFMGINVVLRRFMETIFHGITVSTNRGKYLKTKKILHLV